MYETTTPPEIADHPITALYHKWRWELRTRIKDQGFRKMVDEKLHFGFQMYSRLSQLIHSPSFSEPLKNEREIKEIIEALQPLPENGRCCFNIDWKKERLRYMSEKLEAEMEAEEKRHLARAAKLSNQEFEELKKSVKKLCDVWACERFAEKVLVVCYLR